MMKKHVILITLLIVLGLGEALAQSTYKLPYKGHTHNYQANITDGGTLATRWYVTNASGTKLTQGSGLDYEISSTVAGAAWSDGDNAIVGTGVSNVDIKWGTGLTAGAKYYVYVEVDDDGTEACTNKMALEVTIAGKFNVVAYSVMGIDTGDIATSDDGDGDTEGCPDDIVNPVWNEGTGKHGDIGTSEVVFKVERQFSALAWDFQYNIDSNGGALTGLTNVTVKNADGSTNNADATNANTISMASGQDYALVYVTVTNVQGSDIIVDLNILAGDVEDTYDTEDADGNEPEAGDNAEYTIQPIPEITGFSSGD